MEDRANQPSAAGGQPSAPPCTRCQGQTRHATALMGVSPRMDIYKCEACGHYEWIQQDSGAERR